MSKPIICLDFDGVLHSYTSGWKGADVIPDPPVPGAIEFILRAGQHFNVAIFSSRSNQTGGIKAMVEWLIKHGLDPEAIHRADQALHLGVVAEDLVERPWHGSVYFPTEKPPAMVSIDDRCLTFTGVWPAIDELLSFQPWNKRGAA
jgi:hypothetical protein